MQDAAQEAATTEAIGVIVSSLVGNPNNRVDPADLPGIIRNVRAAMTTAPEPVEVRPEPKVSVKKSVQPDHIVCLEDGKKFKSLKRHLMSHYNMTPEEYRERWGLPADYPMVAPNYAASRSALAKRMGLGQRRKVEAAPPPAVSTKAAATGGKKPSKQTKGKATTA